MQIDEQTLLDQGFTAEEIAQAQEEAENRKRARQSALDALGRAVQGRVDDAVKAREASGIEGRWRDDLRQYYGEDVEEEGANGIAERAASGQQGPGRNKQRPKKSRVVVNITRPKTNSVIARLSDMMLPTDDKNWGIQATPNPKLADEAKNDGTILTQGGVPMQDENGEPLTAAKEAQRVIKRAAEAAKNMERSIEDDLVECDYNRHQRRLIWFACVLGTGIMKGPVAMVRRSQVWMAVADAWELKRNVELRAGSKVIDPRNFFPDPTCEGDLRRARYGVEKENFNAKTLRQLRDDPSFIKEAILECLKEGPQKAKNSGRSQRKFVQGEYALESEDFFEVFHVHGQYTKGELEDVGVKGCECENEDEREDVVGGCVVICNGRVIKAFLSPIDVDDIPYDALCYERIEGQVFGAGIPYILRNPQRVVTAAWRMALDNAALSAGGQIVVNKKVIEPADGVWEIRGSKLWVAKDASVDVRQAFETFQFDTRQTEIMSIIEWSMKFSEDESSMPALMEGQQGERQETLGQATLRMNSANTVMRRLVKEYDDNITDPHITRYYHWKMTHEEDNSIKGDFQVDARGSSVLLVRDLQRQSTAQIGTWVVHPQFVHFHKRSGYDWLKNMYESNYVDSKDVLIDEDEVEPLLKQMREQQSQQAPDPRIEAAKLDSQTKLQLAALERDLAMLKYASEQKKTLEQVKKELAALAIKEHGANVRQIRELEHARTSPTGQGI